MAQTESLELIEAVLCCSGVTIGLSTARVIRSFQSKKGVAMIRRLLFVSAFLLLLFPITNSGISASLRGHEREAPLCLKVQKAVAAEEAVEEGTKEEAGAETEEAEAEEAEEEKWEGPPPAIYFVQWLILLATLILGLAYAYRVAGKGRSHHEGTKLAYALVVLVLLYFALNYYPAVVEYNESGLEPGFISLLKVLLLIITGVLVTFYGVLGRHDEH